MNVINPRTGEADYLLVPLDAAQLRDATAGLRAAQPAWAALSPDVRSEALRRLATAIDSHRAAIAAALTIDTGRKAISAIEVDGTIRTLNRWAAAAPELIARTAGASRASLTPGVEITTQLVPYQLVGVISPWNFPVTLALIDAIPALAAGCAVIVKPSEVTPRFIAPLMAAIREVPEIPLLVIEGDGTTGATLVDHVDYIAFTGSVATGRKVAEAAAAAFIPASLELGGKDPMIVLASADPVSAAAIALRASVVNTGQACQSIERVYVARAIAAPFIDALVEKAEQVRLNAADIAIGDIGPFIATSQARIVQSQIDDARAKGGNVRTGGTVERHGGLYLRPTVITDVTPDMAVIRDESFGPVIPVTIFDSVEEAIAQANDGAFGLSAAVIGDDDEAMAIAARLEVGAVSINDGSLTSMVWDGEKSSFCLSGLGPSRMGDSGLTRFFRRRVVLRQMGAALPLAAYAEDARR